MIEIGPLDPISFYYRKSIFFCLYTIVVILEYTKLEGLTCCVC